MNSEGEKRKRRAFDHTLTDHDGNHSQPQLQYAKPIGNLQQPLSSASNYINAKTMAAAEVEVEEDYLDSLPVGYRFMPTDEELIKHYLLKKIRNEFIPKTRISETAIYENHPQDIVGNYPQAIEGGWYFFTPRTRKYPNGDRPDRQAGTGFWKASGPDKVIIENRKTIGGRKSLVYHEGRAPNWTKTKWMMHEYVVEGYDNQLNSKGKKFNDYVLCKIYINGRREKKAVVGGRRVANDTTNETQVVNEQTLVPDQPGNLLLLNQDGENNVVAQHDSDQILNPATLHVDDNSPVLDSNQHTNPTIVKGKTKVVVPDQPPSFQVENNLSKMINSQLMFCDQRARAVSYVKNKNNTVVQKYQNTGSHYDLMMPYSLFTSPIQVKSIQGTKMDHCFSARFNDEYPLQHSYFASTSQQPPTPPPRYDYARQSRLEMCWSQPQVAPPSQEGSDGYSDDVIGSIELMYAQDGYDGLLDDNYDQFQLHGNEHLDADGSKKHM